MVQMSQLVLFHRWYQLVQRHLLLLEDRKILLVLFLQLNQWDLRNLLNR